MPNRHGSTGDYRYGFNGMEKDDELKGEGNIYDFGARMLDPRVGRWFAPDPKANKYPSESSYTFASNSPLMCIDPDGEEKIVISGGADKHNNNRLNFIMSAKTQLKNYLTEVKNAKSEEKVTWMIFNLDYTPAEKKQFAAFAKANGIAPPVYVKTAQEVKNYLNAQDSKKIGLTQERKDDQVTDVSAFSHGTTSNVAFGYQNTNYSYKWEDPTNLNYSNISDLDKGAFADGCEIDLFSCNSATPGQNLKQDFPTLEKMKESCLNLPSLVSELSGQTGQTVSGYIGRTDYAPVISGKLPTGGKTGGDYSPTVKKQKVNSIKVKAVNGKATTN